MSRAHGEWQEVVVNKVIAAKSDEDKCLVYKPLCLLFSNECIHPFLVLLEKLKLPGDSYNVELQKNYTTLIDRLIQAKVACKFLRVNISLGYLMKTVEHELRGQKNRTVGV